MSHLVVAHVSLHPKRDVKQGCAAVLANPTKDEQPHSFGHGASDGETGFRLIKKNEYRKSGFEGLTVDFMGVRV